MAKKDKVQFQYSDDLDTVDSELAAAMEHLDQTNTRITELLQTYDNPGLDAANASPAPPPEEGPEEPQPSGAGQQEKPAGEEQGS